MNEIFKPNQEQDRRQPYRADLRNYLSSFHARIIVPNSPHSDEHESLERLEKKAAIYLQSSDNAARYVSNPQYQSAARRQKADRGSCAIGMSMCIDGRMVPILLAGPVIDVAEAKAGLIVTTDSPLDGTKEIASARITEAIIDRPLKENSQLLQIIPYHGDTSREAIDCAAINQLIAKGILPENQSIESFRQLLEKSGEAIGMHYNNSAKRSGKDVLNNISLTAFYDTRTAGFRFGEGEESLFTTDLTRKVLKSDDYSFLRNVVQADSQRQTFIKPETLVAREGMISDLFKLLTRKNSVFSTTVDNFVETHLPDDKFTPEQQKAFKFFVARNVAFQYITGLYHGGEHPLSSHNEQYISFSPDGARVGQSDPEIQSFGATVSNHLDTLDHLKTKVELLDRIGKSKPPHIAFLSKAQPDNSSYSTDRNTRAELRSTMQVIYQDQDLLQRIKAGELVIVPVVLQEKTGAVKSIPNLAI